MNAPDPSWTPSRELLAAFADGELEGLPHLGDLRRQIEDWLAVHPEACEELKVQSELTRLMRSTVPAEPLPAAWDPVWAGVVKAPRPPSWPWKLTFGILGITTATAAAVVLAILLGSLQPPAPSAPGPGAKSGPAVQPAPQPVPQPAAVTPLEVVTADEVEIVRVAGNDTASLPVGRPPLTEPVVLLDRHEVEVQPPTNNPARTEIRVGRGGPMVWTPLGDDDDELR
jgi:hypothetical protein